MPVSKDYFSRDYFFNSQKSNYNNYQLSNNDNIWNPVVKIIKKYNINGRMLDIGCAFGYLLLRTNTFFKEVYGIDISDFAIEKARKVVPRAKLKNLDLNKDALPYPDNYFDLITAYDVLEHTESLEKNLRKILPKLKENGFLVICVPLKDTLSGKMIQFFNKDVSHISVPSRRELMSIISKLNLKIIEKNCFLLVPFFNTIFRLKGMPASVELVLKK